MEWKTSESTRIQLYWWHLAKMNIFWRQIASHFSLKECFMTILILSKKKNTAKMYYVMYIEKWESNVLVIFCFVDEARENGCGVLVHCLAGISRSVTVTVAYLMQKEQMTLNQAYDHVKRCKPNISPNFNFMGQLLDFEKSLSGNNTQGHPGFFCQRSNTLESDSSVRQTWALQQPMCLL